MPGRTDDKAKQSFSKGHRESADDVRREGTERWRGPDEKMWGDILNTKVSDGIPVQQTTTGARRWKWPKR